MKRFSRMAVLPLAFIVLQIVGASSPGAVLRDRSWELGLFVSGAFLDNDSNVDDSGGFGLRAGYFFINDHALEVSIDDVLSEVEDNSSLEVDLLTFKVGYLYTFMPRARVTPHLTAGAGVQNLTVYRDICRNDDDWWDDCRDTIIDENDPLAYVGVGMRAFFGRSMHLRADYQANGVFPDDGDEDLLLDHIVNVGIGWIFGGGR